MSYAKVLFLVAGVTVLGMLGAEKLRAQPSPVDCDRYAQDYARNHSRNGQVLRGAGQGAAMLGHLDRRGLNADAPANDPSRTWNSAHPSRGPDGGCSQADLRSTGGDGLLYCFAAN